MDNQSYLSSLTFVTSNFRKLNEKFNCDTKEKNFVETTIFIVIISIMLTIMWNTNRRNDYKILKEVSQLLIV